MGHSRQTRKNYYNFLFQCTILLLVSLILNSDIVTEMNVGISPQLSRYQWFGAILLSLNFWYSGVLLVSNVSYYINWSIIVVIFLSVVTFPFALFSIRGVEWLTGLNSTTSRSLVTIITLIVSILHSAALYLMPNWYDVSGRSLILAASWLTLFSATVLITSYSRTKFA